MEEEFIIDGLDSSLECPVGPEDYEGKQYYDYSDDLCDPNDPKKYDTHYREGLLPGLTVDQLTGVGDKPDGEGYDKGYDLTWTGYGDMTDGATGVFVEELVYLTDENGEIVYENGFPVVDMEKSTFITVGNKMTNDPETGYQGTGMVSSPVQFALQHENGNYFYAYCMDAATGASPTKNKWYSIQNLEDAIESSENPEGYITVDEAAMIRAIATNGYWGTDPNVTNEDGSANRGSIAAMKELLQAQTDHFVLYATWGRKSGSETLAKHNWTTEEMNAQLLFSYRKVAESVGAKVSPVGSSFLKVTLSNPEINLHNPDFSHPSYHGSCLAALTHYYTLFEEFPCVTTSFDLSANEIFAFKNAVCAN